MVINDIRRDLNSLSYIEEGFDIGGLFKSALKALGPLINLVFVADALRSIKNDLKHDDYENAAYDVVQLIIPFIPGGIVASIGMYAFVGYLQSNPNILRGLVGQIESAASTTPQFSKDEIDELHNLLGVLKTIESPTEEDAMLIKKIELVLGS